MAQDRFSTRAFPADLLSSPPPINRPDISDPSPQPSTFRAPSPIASESDESLANAADDDNDDETVRGYVLQDVEDADDLEDLEMDRFGFRFIDEDTEQSATTNSMGHMALNDAGESSSSEEIWNCGLCNIPHSTPEGLQDHCMEAHNYDGKDQLGPRGIGLISIRKMESMERVHERCLKKLRRRRDPLRALKAYVPRAQLLLRDMTKAVDTLLAETMKDVVETGFQSQRGKALNTYRDARWCFAQRRYWLKEGYQTSRQFAEEDRQGRSRPVPRMDDCKMNRWIITHEGIEEMQRAAKIHRELQELDRIRDLFIQHQGKRKQALQRAPWKKPHRDPIHLKTDMHHRRRHRLWRKCTLRNVWLRRRGTQWVAADQQATN